MAGSGTIRWRESDAQRLARDVKNFNSKLSRILKKDPEAVSYLPEKKSVREIKARITSGEMTRKDVNRTFKSMESFSKKGAEAQASMAGKPLPITKWEKRQIQTNVNVVNKKRAAERDKLPEKINPESTGSLRLNGLTPINVDYADLAPGRGKELLIKSLEIQRMDDYMDTVKQGYKDNYLSAIAKNLGTAGQRLYDLVSGLTPQQVYEGYYSDPIMTIQFTSDPLEQEAITEAAMQHWEWYLETGSPME